MKYKKISIVILLPIISIALFVASCVRIKVQSADSGSISSPPIINACKVPTFSQQDEVVHEIKVSRHANASISPDEARKILEQATEVAQEGHGNLGEMGDTACRIRFKLVEAMPNQTIPQVGPQSLPQGGPLDCIRNGEICSEFDFNVMSSQDPSGSMKVVKAIRWCNFPRVGVDGCTEKNRSMIVRRMCEQHGGCPRLEGIAWLHEFGHLQGLYHRPNYSEPAVMKDNFTTLDLWLNSCECMKYRQRRDHT